MGVRGCVFFRGLKGLVKYRTSYIKNTPNANETQDSVIGNTVGMAGGDIYRQSPI